MSHSPWGQAHQEALFASHLNTLFGEFGPRLLQFARERAQWVSLPAGEVLMRQGEPGDAAYLAVSGRLRAYIADEAGRERMVREMGRGEIIGELSLYTGEPRSATVIAVRDTVLARLDQAQFQELLALDPRVSMLFTSRVIQRLRTEHLRRPWPAPVTVALLPVTAEPDAAQFARELAAQLAAHGRVAVLDSSAPQIAAAAAGATPQDAREADARVALAIDAVEAGHDFVLLVADAGPSDWTRNCVHHADEILLLADATATPAVSALERSELLDGGARLEAAQILVLLHPAGARVARGARAWRERRPVAGHVNLRRGHAPDLARLARIVARKAVGLVLAGGGARGFAHLGIWRKLREAGVELDFVGGTSIGALMAVPIAADLPIDEALPIARRAFANNPSSDYNLLPLVSLIKGGRMKRAMRGALAEIAGGEVDIEEMWKSYFCVASNYSQAREQVIGGGGLERAMRATAAIPGAFPPVVMDGDLLCDGGTFNNLPVDAMRQVRGVGCVIGVDLGVHSARRLEFEDVPGSWELLLDRLRPRAKRRYRLPSLVSYLLNVTILYSVSRRDEVRRASDVYFNPPLYKVGLLDWSRFEAIVGQGEAHAVEVLAGLDARQRALLGLAA
ncbi:MAG TPA: cyclic nucleotide-binding domain-containing protein [Burkholderiaceae bacterium]|nr:cyclic nucleotide-binding domain-containing protein [Burkholderiaceae bacterium]